MAYIGREPVTGNFVKLDSITVVNGQAAYTMNNGGSAFTAYDNVNQFLVSLNGVLQAPTDSFTVSGSTLTFASNLATGDVIDFVIVLGDTLDIGTPSDNTVSLAKLTATGTKDATTFLRGDNTFAEAGGGKVLQVVSAVDSTERTTTSTSYVTASNNLSANITPSATSSKVLILASSIVHNTSNGNCYYTIYRDSSNVTSNSGNNELSRIYGDGGNTFVGMNMSFLDSPNTTSQVTYQVRMKVNSDTGYLNVSDSTGSITVMEIGA